MCMYNIFPKDELLSETRRSFDSETAMDTWLQQQVEALLVAYNASQEAARRKARLAIAAMRRQSEENGNAAMTLDDINNEISQARKASAEDFPDPDDRVFYEVALSKDDSYVVTGNMRHFPRKPIVVSPAQFLDMMEKDNSVNSR